MKTILGIPCFGCEDIEKCNTNYSTNPEECMKLTNWINENILGVERTLDVGYVFFERKEGGK